MCTNPILLYYNTKEHKYVVNDSPDTDMTRAIWASCGKCPECKKNRKQSYTVRARAEYQKYGPQRCFMLNLTVNDFCIDKVFPDNSLVHTEFQKFMKRLRRKLELNGIDVKIKYVVCGEYGDGNDRPHFHAIIYGWKPDDLKPFGHSKGGFKQYRSQFVEECWRDVDSDNDYEKIDSFNEKYQNMRQCNGDVYDYLPLGMLTIGEVFDSTIGYLTKYVVKNADISKEVYAEENNGRRKPYCIFPREMLGFEWFLENYKQILKLGYSLTRYGKCSIPRNWLKKFREVAETTENETYLEYLSYYEDRLKEYFKEMYKEMMDQGFRTRLQMYEEVCRLGREKMEYYKNLNQKIGVSYM